MSYNAQTRNDDKVDTDFKFRRYIAPTTVYFLSSLYHTSCSVFVAVSTSGVDLRCVVV